MPLMLLSLVMGRIEAAPAIVRPIAKGIASKVRGGYLGPNVKRNLDFMEETLSNSQWFCGDTMTAADIQMSFALEAAEVRSNLSEDYPHCAAFLERARGRLTRRRLTAAGTTNSCAPESCLRGVSGRDMNGLAVGAPGARTTLEYARDRRAACCARGVRAPRLDIPGGQLVPVPTNQDLAAAVAIRARPFVIVHVARVNVIQAIAEGYVAGPC